MRITPILKRLISDDLRTLYEAGYLDSCNEFTREGAGELEALIFEGYKDKLVELAKAKIAKEKEDKKK